MTKLSFLQEDLTDPGLRPVGVALRQIEWSVPEDIAEVDMVELYLAIESAFDMDRGVVVQFINASAGSGSAEVALDMAWVASSVLGKKVLALNCTQTLWTAAPAAKPINGAEHGSAIGDELVKVQGREMYLARLDNWSGRTESLARLNEIRAHLEEFGSFFDMILIVAPPADSEPLGMLLASHVDGNVLVVEAERTHRSQAIRLREVLSRCGKPILGAVLHDRQDHVPHWLARIL